MIRLSKDQHNYVMSLLDDELKNKILDVATQDDKNYKYDMGDDLEIDFYDFLQDKQVEIGLDKNSKPNKNWEKLQLLIDEVYDQTN